MNYVVLDMEWNQPFGKNNKHVKNGITLTGEIIQIGAVKMDETGKICDTFKVQVRPRHYTKINWKVKKITKITQSEMESGVDIHIAIKRFAKWCGEDFVFLTWGFDDIPILRMNLEFFKIPTDWLPEFYNVQVFFNQQTENRGRQYSLEFAAEYFGVMTDMDMHDALNDAYHTALVCEKMDMNYGMEEYYSIVNGDVVLGNNYRGIKATEEIASYPKSVDEALKAKRIRSGICPECSKYMDHICTAEESKFKYYILSRCKKHGEFVTSLKFTKGRGKGIKLVRNMYAVETDNLEKDFMEWSKELKNGDVKK